MKNDLMELFINGDVAINCRTQKAYNKFLKLCDEYSLEWNSGHKASSPPHNYWRNDESCLTYRHDSFTGLGHGDIDCYSDCRIIEFR